MKLSIVIPIHQVENGDKFLWRSIDMLTRQTFQDFEIVITQQGKMAHNTNAGIKRAKGELIKILYLDDTLASETALEEIVNAFTDDTRWLFTGADNNPYPYWTDDIETGNNKLGSPSALTIRNDNPLLFDENMSWLLDCDYYKRMYNLYGEPVILDTIGVNMGIHDGQVTHTMTDADKLAEFNYIKQKYE